MAAVCREEAAEALKPDRRRRMMVDDISFFWGGGFTGWFAD